MTLEPEGERDVLTKLRAIPKVSEAHFLYGPYDAYIKADAQTTKELEDLVIEKIRSVKGIRSTITCFIAG